MVRRWSWIAVAMAATTVAGSFPLATAQVAIEVTPPRPNAAQATPAPAKPVEIPPYWVGLQLEALSDVLKSQLGLDHGMVVVDVVAESPAAKAGLQKNDILLAADKTSIAEVADLLKAVAESKKNPMVLSLLRGGKHVEATVSPADRPAPNPVDPLAAPPVPFAPALPGLPHFRVVPDPSVEGGIRWLQVQPGVVTQNFDASMRAALAVALPDGYRVTIRKEGALPAEIVVTKKDASGDKEWKVNADKLHELPEEVRGIVEPLVKQIPREDWKARLGIRWAAGAAGAGAPEAGFVPPVGNPQVNPQTVVEQMLEAFGPNREEIKKQVEAMSREIRGATDEAIKTLESDEFRKSVRQWIDEAGKEQSRVIDELRKAVDSPDARAAQKELAGLIRDFREVLKGAREGKRPELPAADPAEDGINALRKEVQALRDELERLRKDAK